MSKFQQLKSELKEHKKLLLLSLLFFIATNVINYFSGVYVDLVAGPPVPDIILSNIPTIDLSIIFIYGYIIILGVFILYPLFFKTRELHIAISQFSLIVLIRSVFIMLTHFGAPAGIIAVQHSFYFFDLVSFPNALFFSGHTALPFLGFLIFQDEKIKHFFLISTIIMAVTVLLMHIHYSIDVFAALFITYGSYKMGNRIFKGEWS